MSVREDGGATPQAIMEMARGFQESRMLLSAAELDVFTHLAGGRHGAAELAQAIGADARALAALLDALVALGVLEKDRDGTYGNTPTTAQLLVRDAPGSMLAALAHSAHMWERWSALTDVVRSGRPAALPEVNQRGSEWLESFLGAMDVFAREAAPQVAAAVGLSGVRRMLDVGGGAASYAIAFAQAEPELTAVVFDLPNVVPIAQRHIRRAGLEARLTTQAGDYRTDTFGSGFDLALLSAIVHSNSFEENADLVRRCYDALVPGGRLVIRDFIMSPDRTQPAPGALFAINMLVSTEGGGTYTEAEMRAWLETAGFREIQRIDLPGMNALMIGRR
ncbi:MAG: methyltransferase domain-containing protein [Armatimonadetes bacterium]|jgi:SAM-dependent methyltransferase|nr:methyltransferase domain-containing protein [Armatimonadota bacterium]